MAAEIPPLAFLDDGPVGAEWTLLLAHGAGAAMDSPFLDFVARGLAQRGIRVRRFEFPYMRRRRQDGRRRPPDREPVLRACFQEAIDRSRDASGRLAIGGKSMGGRIASMVADEAGADALLCLGYPFHPPGRPDRLRTAHLADLKVPATICQGTRDPFGNLDEVAGYDLAPVIRVHWIEGAGHDLCRSGSTESRNRDWAEVVGVAVGFLERI